MGNLNRISGLCVDILAMISFYSFAKCCRWEKLDKGLTLFILFLQLNVQLCQNKRFN